MGENSKHEKIIETARKRFKVAEELEQDIRKDALDDTSFRSGQHWPLDVLQERKFEERPCLTINRIPQFVRKVTNDQRQNRPAIKVYPVDDNADIDTAKVLSGMIRHIENNSNAEIAYDTAFEQAVIGGYGYFRIVTDYCDPLSFDQELRIEAVKDRFKVYLDPFYERPDGSDAEWGFIAEDIPVDTYKAKWGESSLAKAVENPIEWSSLGDSAPGWIEEKTVRVCEYFYKEYETKTLLQLNTGAAILEDEFEDWVKENMPDITDEERERLVEKKRKTQVVTVCAVRLNGVEVLEKTTFPGSWIPIIPVLGDDFIVDGKRKLEGLVRHAKDPQRMLNYWASAETEAIALAPKAPFIAAEGQIPKEYEHQWRQANKKSYPYLIYKPKDHEGNLVPAPQRNTFEPPVQSITNARMQSSEDLKSVTGIYDDALGIPAGGNEKSGKAIIGRQKQSESANFHFLDNLTRSIRHAGRIMVAIIPVIYDAERAALIMGEDGQTELIKINQVFERDGKQAEYRLGFGKYDVTVDTGPSFQTRRQEAMESILAFIDKYPAASPMVGDLIAQNSDWPGAQEIAERLKLLLPQELKEEQPIPPQALQQIEQMKATVEQLTQDVEFKNALIAEKTFEKEQKAMELESKERIEFNKMDTNLKIKTLEAQAEHGPIDPLLMKDVVDEIMEIRRFMLSLNYPVSQTQPSEQGGPNGAAPTVASNMPTGGPAPGISPEGLDQ